MEEEIEHTLNALITKAVAMINKPQPTLSGKLKKFVFKAFVDTADLHRQVPAFARQIMAEIEKPSTKHKLKGIAQSKLQELGQQTYDSSAEAEERLKDSLFTKYHVIDAPSFETNTTSLLITLRQKTYDYAFGMLASTVIILLLWGLLWKRTEFHVPLFVLSVLSALILLMVGLTTTMIELDARIKELDFRLIGTTICFKNQVLFFQSKSILDVVKILINTGKWDMIIVGLLIFVLA